MVFYLYVFRIIVPNVKLLVILNEIFKRMVVATFDNIHLQYSDLSIDFQ
jgi:hypothetical protein